MSVERDLGLWSSIARALYSGLAAYGITVLIALLRDFTRNRRITASARDYASILRAYANFCSRYRDTNIFLYAELLRLITNVVICVFYVIGTYRQDVPAYTSIFYRVCAVFFVLDNIFFILVAESALAVVMFTTVLVDAFTFPSLILSDSQDDYLNFAYLRAIAAFCAYARFERRAFVHVFKKHRLLAKLCFQTLTLFYTLSATIQLLEIPGDLLAPAFVEKWDSYGSWNFMNSAYFIIVTLSTVGYGDLSPSTIQGRIYALFIIIIGIIVFSSVVAELVDQANRERGSGYFIKNSRTRHVIVTGTPNITEVVHFVAEFYSDSRHSNMGTKLVVLVENPTWSDSEWFQYIARNQFLQARLQFLAGSAMNPSDLARARIQSADAVFILTSPSTCDEPYISDTKTVMIILAIRNVRNDVPIYAQTLLEDSSLQTDVALSTVPNASVALSSSRDSVREDCARYPGLYRSVIDNELKNLPRKSFQRMSRRYMESVLRRNLSHRQELLDFNRDAEGALSEALHVSQHVCLQEIQIALISGNIRTNGVGTLISNMYLDVPVSKLTREDPGWLFEYQMGANANLVYSVVPDELDGVCIRDIAGDLYFCGMLIMAVTDSTTMEPHPATDTTERLHCGDLVMLLTYLSPEHILPAFFLVSIRYSRGERRYPLGGTEDEHPGIQRDLIRNLSGGLKLPNESIPKRKYSVIPRALKLMTRKASADDLEALVSVLGGQDGEILPAPRKGVPAECPVGELPNHLHGHVILALEGEAPLNSLPMFLRNLWRKDDRASMKDARRAKVVVVHPSFPDGFQEKYEFCKGSSLFFIEGSPASRATWRKAKLKTASAVATMADITQDPMTCDARTIFTLLTLDVATSNDHDLFIISELVDEKSLEYLREPIHARRRGARLGESAERSRSQHGEPCSITAIRQSRAGHRAERDGQTLDEDVVEPVVNSGTGTADELSPVSPESTTANESGGRDKKRVRAIKFASDMEKGGADGSKSEAVSLGRLGSKARPTGLKQFVRVASMKASSGVAHATATDGKGLNIGSDLANVANELQAGTDPSNRPGAARARRSTLFSRSRYASGELLVQSSAITLIAREYLEPGFVSVFTSVLGTDFSNPGMKIRLVRIPKSMFDSATSNTCPRGRPLIRYMDVFMALVSLGVTPLGIYRSGSAPVLIPHKKRRKRGEALTNELSPLLEQVARQCNLKEMESSKKPLAASSALKGVLDVFRDVNPVRQRENLGRDEINGNMKNLFDDDDDDDDDDENDVDDEGEGEITPDDNDMEAIAAEPNSSRLPKKRPILQMLSLRNEESKNVNNTGAFRRWGTSSFFRSNDADDDDDDDEISYDGPPVALERTVVIPGSGKYTERQVAGNLLPYVYTYPDPNTWCAENDGIYILCESSLDLPRKWSEHRNPNEESGGEYDNFRSSRTFANSRG